MEAFATWHRPILTFVAVDRQGSRVRVPPLQAESEEDQRRYEDAGRRREQALTERERKQSARALPIMRTV